MTGKVALKAHQWARADDEWYVEEPRVTTQLLGAESFRGVIYDPACGQGNIVKVCRSFGLSAFGTDIVARTGELDWFLGTHDFLSEDDPQVMFENIITNPPFGKAKLAEAFIRRALPLVSGKLAVFVDKRFIAGTNRAKGLYREHPPSRIWFITPRPSCPPGEYLKNGGKAEGGRHDFAWLVWDKTAPALGMSLTGWLTL